MPLFHSMDHSTRRVCLRTFTKAVVITPNQPHRVSGRVDRADNRYPIIGSAQRDTRHEWPSTSHAHPDGAGGSAMA